MKQTQIIMGMPVTVEVVSSSIDQGTFNTVFNYFRSVDEQFSTYKPTSEISAINAGNIRLEQASPAMQEVFKLCKVTKEQTNGYFDILHDGKYDPSGIVKGWAILQAAEILKKHNFHDFHIEAGGDIQASGKNVKNRNWRVGIRNPFNTTEVVKIVEIRDEGVATSGTYERGQHIYNPYQPGPIEDIMSITVIGPNIYEADRFATAAFAMGRKGVQFIEKLDGFEAYLIDREGIGTYTSHFDHYVHSGENA